MCCTISVSLSTKSHQTVALIILTMTVQGENGLVGNTFFHLKLRHCNKPLDL